MAKAGRDHPNFVGDKVRSEGVGRPANKELTPLQLEFIDWLVDPDRSGTLTEWASTHDVHRATLAEWKKRPLFKDAWEKRITEEGGSPENMAAVMAAVLSAAKGGDMKAASLWLQYNEKWTPTKRTVVEDRTVADLSDEELSDELEGAIQHLRAV